MTHRSLFYDAIVAAAQSAEDMPLNVSRFGHGDIVDGLHRVLHSDRWPATIRSSIRILTADGSEAARFPLVHLGSEPRWDPSLRPLRVGFVSGRHPELDRVVDFYLLRNSEIRRFDVNAELEQEVYERARRLFDEAAATGVRAVEALHTGLETVTIGFYRAVVEHAQAAVVSATGTMHVRPRIWRAPSVDVDLAVTQSKGALDGRAVRVALTRVAGELPAFVRIDSNRSKSAATTVLQWIPQRPMLASERDWLARRARAANPIIDLLHHVAQYRDGGTWKIA
jgi:hypothetical protein